MADKNLPSVKKNFIYDLFYQILTIITPFITAPYIARVLGTTCVGIQSYTNSVVTYFALFGSLGVAVYGQREIARKRHDGKEISLVFWELTILRGVSLLAATVIYLFMALQSERYGVYLLVLTMTLIGTAFDISWFFQGLENFAVIVVRNTIIKILGIVLTFLLVKSQDDLLLYIAMLAASGMLGNISVWFYLPRYLQRVHVKEMNIRRHIKETFVYFVPTIATSIYIYLDKVMIGAITSEDSENGYYEYATQIVSMAKIIFLSLNNVMASRMSLLFEKKKHDEIHALMDESIDFTMFLGWPIMFGMMGIVGKFVPWFLGDGYEETCFLVQLTAPLILIIAISNVIGSQYLTPSGQRARSNKVICTGAVVNFVLNLILIPQFQSRGAAIASVAAELVITVWYLYMGREYVQIAKIRKYSMTRLPVAVLMFVAVLAIGRRMDATLACTLLQVLSGGAIYLLCLYLLRDKFLCNMIEKGKERVKELRR